MKAVNLGNTHLQFLVIIVIWIFQFTGLSILIFGLLPVCRFFNWFLLTMKLFKRGCNIVALPVIAIAIGTIGLLWG